MFLPGRFDSKFILYWSRLKLNGDLVVIRKAGFNNFVSELYLPLFVVESRELIYLKAKLNKLYLVAAGFKL
ncbi:hypothetical protein GCM10027170_11200 [Aliiglaciecola aliphaticivorans]